MSLNGFDRILDEKIGYGNYQRICYLLIGLIALSDEAEIISLSVILPTLKKEWNLDESQEELIGSVLFFGIFLGSLGIGLVSDKMGRRRALLISSGLQFIFGIASAFVENFKAFLLVRTCVGLMIGCTIPIAPTYITEISPTSHRGKGQVYIQAFFVIGMVYAMVLSKIFIGDLDSGNWRALLIFGALPSLIVLIGTWLYLMESPRFLIATGNINKGISVLNKMGAKNKGTIYYTLSIEDNDELIKYQKALFENKHKENWFTLFNAENRRATLCLMVSWFGLSHNFFGMVFILPLIFSVSEEQRITPSDQELSQLFLDMCGDPASIIADLVIYR
mgnify:FL=1